MVKSKAGAVSTADIIGWREQVRLPKLGVGPITAKIDTGARSAALHAEAIDVHGQRVRFLLPVNGRNHHCELAVKGRRRVRSSSGHSENRIVVETDLAIGSRTFAIEVTLTDRTDMGVPMLLGRAAIRGRFIVDPGRA